jgi:exoribonuclease-2
MERFWTLKYLRQNDLHEIIATVFKDNLVRADDLPLVLPVVGAQGMVRGARVRVKLGDIDLISLDVQGTVIERLDEISAASSEEAAEEDEDEVVGPLAIAVDVNEVPEPSSDN